MKPSGAWKTEDDEFRCRKCFGPCDTMTETDTGGNQTEILYCERGCFSEEMLGK